MAIHLQRAYETPNEQEGARFLVDRIWPRGVKKEDLKIEAWLKEAAPSNELRHWFGHDPQKWPEFKRRYAQELDGNPEAWKPLLEAARQGDIVLVYSARNTEINNAVALADYLGKRL